MYIEAINDAVLSCPKILEFELEKIIKNAELKVEPDNISRMVLKINSIFYTYFAKSIEISVLSYATASQTATELMSILNACNKVVRLFAQEDYGFKGKVIISCLEMQAQLYAEENDLCLGITPMEKPGTIDRKSGKISTIKKEFVAREFIDSTLANIKVLSDIAKMAYDNEKQKVQKGKKDKKKAYSPFPDLLVGLGEVWQEYSGGKPKPGGTVADTKGGQGGRYIRFVSGILNSFMAYIPYLSAEFMGSIVNDLDITKEGVRNHVRSLQSSVK